MRWLTVPVLSAIFEDTDPFGDMRRGLLGMLGGIKGLLEMVMVFAGLVILVRIVFKLMSGDRDSAKTLLYWVIGLVFGLVFLELISNLFS